MRVLSAHSETLVRIDTTWIDQSNVAERSKQVGHIDHFSQYFWFTFVWLETKYSQTDVAIQTISKLATARSGFSRSKIVPYVTRILALYSKKTLLT